eukprot:gene20612-41217_t
MCTGDNLETARAIARQCNILRCVPGSVAEEGVALTGPEFRRMFVDDEVNLYANFKALLPRVQVLARCSPLDKQLLVGMLMLAGEVVAVTGDGTNDAPALKLADVGFAMDDGDSWGRNVNDSIRKFLQFQFTVNVVLLVVTFVGSKPHASNDGPLMEREPTYRNAPLISRPAYQLAIVLTFVFTGPENGDIFRTVEPLHTLSPYSPARNLSVNASSDASVSPAAFVDGATAREHVSSPRTGDVADRQRLEEAYNREVEERDERANTLHRTCVFNIFVYMQVFNWFPARNLFDELNPLSGFDRSPMFLPIVGFTAAFQAFIVEVEQLTGPHDGEGEGRSKYDMIRRVQRLNHDLFGKAAPPSGAPPLTAKQRWHRARIRVKVVRAFRGSRGRKKAEHRAAAQSGV